MHQESFDFAPLGKALRQARKARRLTQQQVAAVAGLSVPTVRLLENNSGILSSLTRLIAVLDLRIDGRNLPAGASIGERIALLRQRRGFTQRSLAQAVALAPATINRLENSEASSIASLSTILIFLGAGAYLTPTSTTTRFYTHAGNSSVHHGWTTPPELLKSLYAVFGTFDLDPCSPTGDRRTAPVRARVYFTQSDNGLELPWHGRVFVNPPYGRGIRAWMTKARREVAERRASCVVALVPARTDTLWWHHEIAGRAAAFMLRGRLHFHTDPAPFPSALVVWGADNATLAAMQTQFPTAWYVAPSG